MNCFNKFFEIENSFAVYLSNQTNTNYSSRLLYVYDVVGAAN